MFVIRSKNLFAVKVQIIVAIVVVGLCFQCATVKSFSSSSLSVSHSLSLSLSHWKTQHMLQSKNAPSGTTTTTTSTNIGGNRVSAPPLTTTTTRQNFFPRPFNMDVVVRTVVLKEQLKDENGNESTTSSSRSSSSSIHNNIDSSSCKSSPDSVPIGAKSRFFVSRIQRILGGDRHADQISFVNIRPRRVLQLIKGTYEQSLDATLNAENSVKSRTKDESSPTALSIARNLKSTASRGKTFLVSKFASANSVFLSSYRNKIKPVARTLLLNGKSCSVIACNAVKTQSTTIRTNMPIFLSNAITVTINTSKDITTRTIDAAKKATRKIPSDFTLKTVTKNSDKTMQSASKLFKNGVSIAQGKASLTKTRVRSIKFALILPALSTVVKNSIVNPVRKVLKSKLNRNNIVAPSQPVNSIVPSVNESEASTTVSIAAIAAAASTGIPIANSSTMTMIQVSNLELDQQHVTGSKEETTFSDEYEQKTQSDREKQEIRKDCIVNKSLVSSTGIDGTIVNGAPVVSVIESEVVVVGDVVPSYDTVAMQADSTVEIEDDLLSSTKARIKSFFTKSSPSSSFLPSSVSSRTPMWEQQEPSSSSSFSTASITGSLTNAVKKTVPAFFRDVDYDERQQHRRRQNKQQKQPLPMEMELKLQAKYAAIESLEERAFQILVDLGMVEIHSNLSTTGTTTIEQHLEEISGEWE